MEVYSMNRPDFQAMSQQELQNYFLAHRDDNEAFYAYIDRLHLEATWVEMPPLQSIEDLENYPEFLARFRESENNASE
jgi:hypothetical protein